MVDSRPASDARERLRRFRKAASAPEPLLIAALTLLYLFSFDLTSPVNGPPGHLEPCVNGFEVLEVFGQDSQWILQLLYISGDPQSRRDDVCDEKTLPFYGGYTNAQNHILYHVLVDQGYRLWRSVASSSLWSTYVYLKIFTALTGLGFLVALQRLLVAMGLSAPRRFVMLALAGVSVSSWFHFAAFETHSLGMMGIALYLLALLRVVRFRSDTATDRLILGLSLLWCGLTRADLWRFLLVTFVFFLVPGLGGWRRRLTPVLGATAAVGLLATVVLTAGHYELPPRAALAKALERHDRGGLGTGRVANVTAHNLLKTGRAVTAYSILMPLDHERDGLDGGRRRGPWDAPIEYFSKPIRAMLSHPLALLSAAGLMLVLAGAAAAALRRVIQGDVFTIILGAQFVSAWVFYTWFNPHEPFLWVLHFLPLVIVLVADAAQQFPRTLWPVLGAMTVVVFVHNLSFFYLAFS